MPDGFELALDIELGFRGAPRAGLASVPSEALADVIIVRAGAGERALVKRSGHYYHAGTFFALERLQPFGAINFEYLTRPPPSEALAAAEVHPSLRLDPEHGACLVWNEQTFRLSDGLALDPSRSGASTTPTARCVQPLRMRDVRLFGDWIYVRKLADVQATVGAGRAGGGGDSNAVSKALRTGNDEA